MFKKNIYRWHRTCSLIVALPVVLWAVSGFMHPIMTNIRPAIATQGIQAVAIDSSQIRVPLKAALQQNKIDSLNTVRFIHIGANWFYQIRIPGKNELQYISVKDGKLLRNGDRLYAQCLARIFLEGEGENSAPVDNTTLGDTYDCCNSATLFVLHPKTGVPVKDVTVVTSFDDSYQSINRVLPVYRVSFKREDGVSVYVETAQDRFVFATNDSRVAFSTFFRLAHKWSWLDFLGKGKLLVEIFLTGLAFLTTLLGIYIFFTTKRSKTGDTAKPRRNHRYTSIVASLFTLMFTFSGCYHALSKLEDKPEDRFIVNTFPTSSANLDVRKIQSLQSVALTNIGLTKIGNTSYWQVYAASPKSSVGKDLMKDKAVMAPVVTYLEVDTYTAIEAGSEKHARSLATQFTNQLESEITSTSLINRFDKEYNFADKFLPVLRVEFSGGNHERCFVEIATGRLSKRIDNKTGYERYSFAFLHKHEFLGGFGKSVKDFSTMFWAAAQVAMVVIGIILYLKLRRRKQTNIG